tara:strand:+ start:398 stop:748 length:351 start_codon:yes stop_codon:yes gene_type:complete
MSSSKSTARKVINMTREAVRQQNEETAWKLVHSHLSALRTIVDKDSNRTQQSDSYELYRNWYFQVKSELYSIRLPHNHKLYQVLEQFHNNALYNKYPNRSLAYQQLSSCVHARVKL